MKIQLLSDLHLEVHPHFVPQPTPGADVLVLAGDIALTKPARCWARWAMSTLGWSALPIGQCR